MATKRLQTFRAALAAMAVVGTLAACGSQEVATTTPAAAASSAVASPTAGADPTPAVSVPAEATSGAASSAAAAEASAAAPAEADSVYTDGNYSATGSYVSPGGQETVDVTLTLTDDVVTEVVVTPHASNPNTQQYQGLFASGIAAEVVGVNIDELAVDKVSGSSLTSGGFNSALEAIKSQARG